MTSKLLEASLSKTQNDGTSTKCSNCQATKTAQWRTGPDGHKVIIFHSLMLLFIPMDLMLFMLFPFSFLFF